MNKVIISGNLTGDPRTNILENGTHVANFRIASNSPYRGKDGEWHDKTCFVDVAVWRDLAERVGARLHKGSPVMIEGELQFTQWEAQDGSKRSRIEILARSVQMVEKVENHESSDGSGHSGGNGGGGGYRPPSDSSPKDSKYDDEIPF